ncbi:MAG TPA: preprotein translocase subunit SecE [Chlamydiales bacterium]|nr:preprotein translocase subunit SecE [Chlamydiales bacterium]
MTAVLTSQVKENKKKTPYLREVQNELSKVSWTSKEEILLCTKVIIGSIFCFGLGIYLIDLAVRGMINLIFYVGKLIGG